MNPLELADSGSRLASIDVSKWPREADLGRAVASNYSACVHALCQTIADIMIGATRASRDTEARIPACKAMEHGRARAICSNQERVKRFPIGEIRHFAAYFVYAQKNAFKPNTVPS